MRVFKPLAAFAAASVICLSVQAVPKYYEIGAGSTVTGDALSEPGLVIQVAFDPALAGRSFTLADTQTETFRFLRIWTDEGNLDWDDYQGNSVRATLDFYVPDLDASVSGTVDGHFGWGGGYGGVEWNGPVTVTAADRTFVLTLTDADFGLDGEDKGLVMASVKQLTSADSVPDSGLTIGLLGGALVGLSCLRRRS